MAEPNQPDLHDVLTSDTRYAIEAYEFLYLALAHTQRMLGRAPKPKKSESNPQEKPHHVTGQELLEGIRCFALDQFGMMARVVFELWGVRSTADFGSMVYLLIEAGLWRRSESDRFEDFTGVYDFAQAFERDYRIEIEGALFSAMMTPIDQPARRWKLSLAIGLLGVWMGFQTVQAMVGTRPIIVSRPQVLIADTIVEGTLLTQPTRIKVNKVWWGDANLAGKEISVSTPRSPAEMSLLAPLTRVGPDQFRLTSTPADTTPIYPATPGVYRQMATLIEQRRKLGQQ